MFILVVGELRFDDHLKQTNKHEVAENINDLTQFYTNIHIPLSVNQHVTLNASLEQSVLAGNTFPTMNMMIQCMTNTNISNHKTCPTYHA